MNFSRFLLVVGFLTTLSFSGEQANAAVMGPTDYTGSFVNMTPEPLTIGQHGTVTSTGSFGSMVMSLITGALPSNSMATFTYQFSGLLTSSSLSTGSVYSYTTPTSSFAGYTTATAPSGLTYSIGFEGTSPSTPLAVSSAQIDSVQKATVVIKNFSAGVLSFANAFIGTVVGSKTFTVAYNVSAVPVPAALPLFGLGLGALAAMRMRSRKKDAASVA